MVPPGSVVGLNGSTGATYGVTGFTNSSTNGASGVNAGATTGVVFGVNGSTNSTTDGAAAVNGHEGGATGQVFGVAGVSEGTHGVGAQLQPRERVSRVIARESGRQPGRPSSRNNCYYRVALTSAPTRLGARISATNGRPTLFFNRFLPEENQWSGTCS